MGWDLAIDIFKVLIISAITWVVIYLRKQAKPLLKSLKKLSKIIETTEELKKEVALLKAEKQAMYDILRDPVFITNEKGEVTYANNSWARMGGLNDPKDGYGFGYMSIIPEEDRELIEKQGKRIIEHPSSFDGHVRFKNKQTHVIVLTECRTAILKDIDNKIIGSLGRLYIISENPK